MSRPVQLPAPIAELVERSDVLRMLREWVAERFAEEAQADSSIAWEDGEEHADEGAAEA